MKTKNPVYSARLVLKMAKLWADDNLLKLTPEQCEALELVDRNIMRLERLMKKG